MSTSTEASVYKAHRIHITRLYSRPYVSVIVRLGKETPRTTHSLTATVTRVPGEYPSEAEAIQAAMRYIDEQEAPLGDPSAPQAAPASTATDRARARLPLAGEAGAARQTASFLRSVTRRTPPGVE